MKFSGHSDDIDVLTSLEQMNILGLSNGFVVVTQEKKQERLISMKNYGYLWEIFKDSYYDWWEDTRNRISREVFPDTKDCFCTSFL